MNWHGPVKAVSIRLPEDLHLAVKSAAPSRVGTLERAYIEALTSWLVGMDGRTVADDSDLKEQPTLPKAIAELPNILADPDIEDDYKESLITIIAEVLKPSALARKGRVDR